MNYSQVAKILKDDGWFLERNGKGSHRIWKHPVKKKPVSVPDHGAKELGKGIVNSILKDAELK